MSALKRLFSGKKFGPKVETSYSAHRSMVKSPPPGQLTDSNDPNHEVWKPQHSSGDQSDEGRLPFFNSGFAACPECGEKNVWRFEEKAGVRDNGDTFGTELFLCQTKGCGWRTSFKFDDSGVACPHYEARHWPRGVMRFPVTFMMMWADKHKLSQQFKHQLFSQAITGDRLLQLEAEGQLADALGLSRKEVDKVRKALHDPKGAQLIPTKK